MSSVTGTFTTTGTSPWLAVKGAFNVSVWSDDTDHWFQIERSFDGGATAIPLSKLSNELVLEGNFSISDFYEPESNVQYRLRCTHIGSAPANYRISF
ncbi:MAG: hypothetical protein AAFQ16_10655 [Pseudomonadota bacterium]